MVNLECIRGSVERFAPPDVFNVTSYQRIYRNWKGERFIGLAGLKDEGLAWAGSFGMGIHVRIDEDRFLRPDGTVMKLSRKKK